MEDPQSPPDNDNRKGDQARRAGLLRLSDAEAVAATRRDMFGDGSLLDALAEHPLPPHDKEQRLDGLPAPVEPVDEQVVGPAVAMGEFDPGASDQGAEAQSPEAGQALDAIIDSFAPIPGDPASPGAEHEPPEPQAGLHLPPASRFAWPDWGAGEPDTASDQLPPPDPDPFQASAAFAALGPTEQAQEGRVVEASQPDALGSELRPEAEGEAEGAAAPKQRAAATPSLGVPLFSQSAAAAAMDEATAWPPMPRPAGDMADETHAEAAADKGAVEPATEPVGWPPFPDPPGTPVADDQRALRKPQSFAGPDEAAAGASASPFPAPPAWPPFIELAGAEADRSAPVPSGLPPYIELPANPESIEERSGPLDPGAEAEAPRFPDSLPEPGEAPRFHGFETHKPALNAAARASAKIAAEADATAQALGNLQRLLNEHVLPAAPAPHPQRIRPQPQPPRPRHAHLDLPDGTAPFPHGEMTPMLPLPVAPPEAASGKNVYLLGFLTGLVLSVMAGAALYFLIAVG